MRVELWVTGVIVTIIIVISLYLFYHWGEVGTYQNGTKRKLVPKDSSEVMSLVSFLTPRFIKDTPLVTYIIDKYSVRDDRCQHFIRKFAARGGLEEVSNSNVLTISRELFWKGNPFFGTSSKGLAFNPW